MPLTSKPRVGDSLRFTSTGDIVTVHHFGEGHKANICYYAKAGRTQPREHTDCFIWRFGDGTLNQQVENLEA